MKQIDFASISPNLSHACKFDLSSCIYTALDGLKDSLFLSMSVSSMSHKCLCLVRLENSVPVNSEESVTVQHLGFACGSRQEQSGTVQPHGTFSTSTLNAPPEGWDPKGELPKTQP